MDYNVFWSKRADKTYEATLDYLDKEWTLREGQNFARRVEDIITAIAKEPFLFERSSKYPNVHRCVVAKQVTLYYKVSGTKIVLLIFGITVKIPIV